MPRITVGQRQPFDSPEDTNIVLVGRGYTNELTLGLPGRRGIVVLGDNTKWTRVTGRIMVSTGAVLVTGRGISSWGLDLNVAQPGALLGDDIMMARGVRIRTHSGHQLLDVRTGAMTTAAERLVIEPHVWLGEGCTLFRCAFVGACSIVGLGALVTHPVPRFSIAKGFPAESAPSRRLWMRSSKARDRSQAVRFYERFVGPLAAVARDDL